MDTRPEAFRPDVHISIKTPQAKPEYGRAEIFMIFKNRVVSSRQELRINYANEHGR
jgi:hypothetical protein